MPGELTRHWRNVGGAVITVDREAGIAHGRDREAMVGGEDGAAVGTAMATVVNVDI